VPEKICIEPDAACEFESTALSDGKPRTAVDFFHIEVYRTLPPVEWRFKQKIKGYVTYALSGQHEALFHTPALAIAVIAAGSIPSKPAQRHQHSSAGLRKRLLRLDDRKKESGFSFAVLIPQQQARKRCIFHLSGNMPLALTKHRFWCWNDKMAVLCYVEGKTMPEFTTVSVQEAQLRTIPGRQGKYVSESADYLLKLPHGQAGKLTIGESEKHTTIRRRLTVAANALDIHIIIKRSGNELYFWRENGIDEQPRTKRRYTRRGRSQEERTVPDQPGDELGMVAQGILGSNPRN
ncbi:MAG TPA: hypothetical protein VHK27_11850, partial [Gammaproteobacteria bacterium]|nr:hypothetical protein [Gammaproteobacteria bacterium]